MDGPPKIADNQKVKKSIPLLLLIFVLIPPLQLNAYFVTYKEQYYRLFHLHYIQYPDDTMENIYWLEKALQADFCNPLYAIALVENETQWEKYRYLFMMHINIKLAEQHLFLGNKWNKRNAYFYNAPWKDQNLDSLNTAETCFKTALYYWDESLVWAEKLNEKKFRFINLPNIQFWEDEAARMDDKSLDYGKTINRELTLLRKVREKFEQMEKTY